MVPGAGRYVEGSATRKSLARASVNLARRGPAASCHTSVMLSPSTLICFSVSGLVAGPPFTEPSVIENLLPSQLQLIVPPSTPVTGHPWCEHVELKHLNSPSVGCVTTTLDAAMIAPPPTGTLLVWVSAPPPVSPPPADGSLPPLDWVPEE